MVGTTVTGAASSTTATPRPVVEFVDVGARYENLEVLHGVSMTVPEGSVFAVLGPNGAGKSTMLAVAAGLLKPTAGQIRIAGHDVAHVDAATLARCGVCLVPEGRGVFPHLTVGENLWMMTYLGVSRADIEERTFSRFPRLADRRHQTAGTMSGGEQQMLGLARALVTDPAVLLLDELSMGLAPIIVADLYDIILRIAHEEHLTVVLVEQFARTVLSVADRAALVVNGRVVEVGDPDAIEAELHTAYLGGSRRPTTGLAHPPPTHLHNDPRPHDDAKLRQS